MPLNVLLCLWCRLLHVRCAQCTQQYIEQSLNVLLCLWCRLLQCAMPKFLCGFVKRDHVDTGIYTVSPKQSVC